MSSGCYVRCDGKIIYADFEVSSVGKMYIMHSSGSTTTHHKQRETSEFCFPGCFRAGDRILLADDSNEDWWKVGTIRKTQKSQKFPTTVKSA